MGSSFSPFAHSYLDQRRQSWPAPCSVPHRPAGYPADPDGCPTHRGTADFREDAMTHHTLLVIASAAAARTVRRILLRAGAGRFKMKFVSRSADACNRPPYGPRTQAIVVDPFCADSQGIDTIHALLRAPVSILILGSARYEGEFDPLSAVHGRPRLSKQRPSVKRSLSWTAKSMLARPARALT